MRDRLRALLRARLFALQAPLWGMLWEPLRVLQEQLSDQFKEDWNDE